MTSDVVFDVPAHVIARRIADETVILDLETGTYFGLDPVGARIWELIAEGHTPNDIREIMVAEYDVTADTLMADLEKLLCNLQDHGLITTTEFDPNPDAEGG